MSGKGFTRKNAIHPKEYDASGKYIDTRVHRVEARRFDKNFLEQGKKADSGLRIWVQVEGRGGPMQIDPNRIDNPGMGIPVFRCPLPHCHESYSVRFCVRRHFDEHKAKREAPQSAQYWEHPTVATYPRQPPRIQYSRPRKGQSDSGQDTDANESQNGNEQSSPEEQLLKVRSAQKLARRRKAYAKRQARGRSSAPRPSPSSTHHEVQQMAGTFVPAVDDSFIAPLYHPHPTYPIATPVDQPKMDTLVAPSPLRAARSSNSAKYIDGRQTRRSWTRQQPSPELQHIPFQRPSSSSSGIGQMAANACSPAEPVPHGLDAAAWAASFGSTGEHAVEGPVPDRSHIVQLFAKYQMRVREQQHMAMQQASNVALQDQQVLQEQSIFSVLDARTTFAAAAAAPVPARLSPDSSPQAPDQAASAAQVGIQGRSEMDSSPGDAQWVDDLSTMLDQRESMGIDPNLPIVFASLDEISMDDMRAFDASSPLHDPVPCAPLGDLDWSTVLADW